MAQVLLKGTTDAVLAANFFQFWEMHRERYGGISHKERHAGAFTRRLYELLYKSLACSIKHVCALLFCLATSGFSSGYFSLDIFFHK
jgi:hypothetical protein